VLGEEIRDRIGDQQRREGEGEGIDQCPDERRDEDALPEEGRPIVERELRLIADARRVGIQEADPSNRNWRRCVLKSTPVAAL
jgi:hypothetical protein